MSGRGVLSLEWANDVPGDEEKSRKRSVARGMQQASAGRANCLRCGPECLSFRGCEELNAHPDIARQVRESASMQNPGRECFRGEDFFRRHPPLECRSDILPELTSHCP